MHIKILLCLLGYITFSLSHATVDAAEALFTQQPSVSPELSVNGKFAVGVITQKITNPESLDTTTFAGIKPRPLTIELWYPAKAQPASKLNATYKAVTRLHKPFELQGQAYRGVEPLDGPNAEFPFVVLSHGYTGDRTLMFYLAEHLASHGYVVASIDHTDSTTAEIDLIKAPFAGFVSTLINRSKDQQFVLDYYSRQTTAIANITNFDQSAIIGYSMGGYGAINTAGGCYSFTEQGLIELSFPKEHVNSLLPVFNFCNAGKDKFDTRWKAMVAFAPWGQERDLHNEKALKEITIPTMYVSGDLDDISGFEHGVKKLFEQTSVTNNYLLVYENARHNIAPHPAPKIAYEDAHDLGHYFEPAWNNEQLTRINEHFTLAFLNCYVKNDSSQCKYLPTRQSATQVKDESGKLSPAWKGFNDRWAVGVQLLRHEQIK